MLLAAIRTVGVRIITITMLRVYRVDAAGAEVTECRKQGLLILLPILLRLRLPPVIIQVRRFLSRPSPSSPCLPFFLPAGSLPNETMTT